MAGRGHHPRRRHRRFRRQTRPGAAPGTVKVDPQAPRSRVRVTAYDAERLAEDEVRDVDDLRRYLDTPAVVWVSVDGLGDEAVVENLGTLFRLHPLALEDVVNVHQRAKVEEYDGRLFIVARAPAVANGHVDTEQISLFLGERFLVTFQERSGDCFDPVRERLRRGQGTLRGRGPDHLAHALLDAVVDSYFPVVDECGDRLEDIDDEISARPRADVMQRIHRVRRDLLVLWRAIRPHRESLNELVRDPRDLITSETQVYLRDCYDHTVQLLETLDSCRDACTDLRDFHLSAISYRMNEVMKVLTIFTAVFIPLTFIAGVYGMNFDDMPELRWRYGYPAVLALMTLVAGGLLWLFWIKGWLGTGRRRAATGAAGPVPPPP